MSRLSVRRKRVGGVGNTSMLAIEFSSFGHRNEV